MILLVVGVILQLLVTGFISSGGDTTGDVCRNKAALTGGSGKVINSGPNDRIFIYYSDHGGPGTLGMPDKSHLYADQLIQGSMLEGLLPQGLNIYATTAANKEEGSWATYCPGGLCLTNDTAGQRLVDDWNCLREMVTTFEIHYGKLAQYGMKHMRISFANICNAGIRTEQMVEASAEACAGIHSDH
ncbi:vacuolar-processing enzyme-like [Gossypium raimondii]|uniref:vacuolar-processing enzyme-like n=1 Tax=Gossypium raimondii TaxID=29730 RepID=UPI00063AD93E|nr:vacuolar-processing enzyme-like [Gossypium raimondii]